MKVRLTRPVRANEHVDRTKVDFEVANALEAADSYAIYCGHGGLLSILEPHSIRLTPHETLLPTATIGVGVTQYPWTNDSSLNLRASEGNALRTSSQRELEDLQASAMRLLDFDDIRNRLADHTTFYEARRLALEITPSFDPFEVERLQRETADARALLDELGDLSLQSDADTSESVTRASLEGVLTGSGAAGSRGLARSTPPRAVIGSASRAGGSDDGRPRPDNPGPAGDTEPDTLQD